MKGYIKIQCLLIFSFFLFVNSSNCQVKFSKSLTKALKLAQKEDKFVFLFAYTEWSIPSQQMQEITFKDSLVTHELHNDYINVNINAGRKKDFAQDYEIHVFPTFMVMDKWGNAIIRGSGFKTPNELLKLIFKTRSKSRYLLQDLDSILQISHEQNIMANLDSVKYYRDDYTAKNLAKKYLDKNRKHWKRRDCMDVLNEYFTLDKRYVKYVSKHHKAFFLLYDSIQLKENIAFHIYINSYKRNIRGRSKFNYKKLHKWFKKYKIKGVEKMEDFVRVKHLLWGRGPSIRSSLKLIENYPETSNESVLYSSVIRILLDEKKYRKDIDFNELIENIEDNIDEGSYWRYDILSLLYYKIGNMHKTNNCIQTAKDIAYILGENYVPILDYLREEIDNSK